MRKLQEKSPGGQPGQVGKAARRPDKRRVDGLKRRCSDDFERLKVSIEMLAAEVGPLETMKFAHAMWVLNNIGLKSPW